MPIPNESIPSILIARVSAHGDVAQTLPLLAALRAEHPRARIGWLVEESAAPLLENHPLLDRLHVSRRKTWLARLKNPLQWAGVAREFVGFLQGIREERYAVGLDVQGLWKSAVLLFLAGIPRRIGYRATRENAAMFYTETLPHHDIRNPNIPTVLKFLEFADAIAPGEKPSRALRLEEVSFPLPPVQPGSKAHVAALLEGLDHNRPTLAIAPATIWPSKHWREEHWKTLLCELAKLDCNVLLMGSPQDRALTERLLQGATAGRFLNLAGETSLYDLLALFPRVDVFVGLDSAPLHIANAVGHSTIVGLYGPTAAGRTGPIGKRHVSLQTRLDCQPCFERVCPLGTHACMKELSPDTVLDAVQDRLRLVQGLRGS